MTGVALSLVVGCAGPELVGYQGGKPIAKIDDAQRATKHPDPIVDADSIETSASMDVPTTPDRVFNFFQHMRVERVFKRTKLIPGPVSVQLLTPSWDRVGSRRRVLHDDQSTSLEEILTFEPGKSFRYVLWNFSNDTVKATRYAVGDLELTPIPIGTHMTFTYDFRGRGFPTDMFLRSVVESDFHEFLGVAIDEIRQQAPSWQLAESVDAQH